MKLKKRDRITVKGNVFREVNQNNNNITLPRTLIEEYELITTAYQLCGTDAIKELVLTKRNREIDITAIQDIAFIFDAKLIDSGAYSICGKVNAFVIRYQYHKWKGEHIFEDIGDWLP